MVSVVIMTCNWFASISYSPTHPQAERPWLHPPGRCSQWPSMNPLARACLKQTCCWSAGLPGRTGSPHSPVRWQSCSFQCMSYPCKGTWSDQAPVKSWIRPEHRWRACTEEMMTFLWVQTYKVVKNQEPDRKWGLTTSCPHWLACCEHNAAGRHISIWSLDPAG